MVAVGAALAATGVTGVTAAVVTPAAPAAAAVPESNVWVVTTPTTAPSTQAVSIARLTTSGASAGAPILLPTAASGAAQAFTLGGAETTTGVLARSADGRSVTLAGYAVAPGTAVSTSVTRGVALIDAAGAVDTSTTLNGALSGSAIRGAVTNDGSAIWASGDGVGASPTRSVVYQPLGAAATPVALWQSATNQYAQAGPIKAYGGSFWVPSDVTNVLYQVGGAPATPTGATLTSRAATAALDFAFVDRDAAVPGVDTLYVAVAAGIEKWATSDGTKWTKIGTSALPGVRRLDARSAGDRSELVAVVGTAGGNTLHRITDTAAPGAAAALSDSTIATAATGTSFRGVAFAPAASGAAPDTAGATPTVTVTPPSGATVNDTVTYSAAVTANSAAATAGDVTFFDGATVLGTAPVGTDGVASLSITQAVGGTRSITAWYSGSDSLLPTRSAAVSADVTRLAVTTTVTPEALVADFSDPAATLTVTLAADGPTPSGPVSITEDGIVVGSASTVNGTAKVGILLEAGSHTVVASYAGNDSFAPSTSAPVSVTINPAPTGTSLHVSSTTVALGSALVTDFTVTNKANLTWRPTGTVDIVEDGRSVATGTLVAGSAAVTIPAAVLTTGTHTFTGRYNGDVDYASSTATTPLTITVASSTVSALTVAPTGTHYVGQQQVTVSGSVAGLPAGGAAPTGTVELLSGTTVLGRATVGANGGFIVTLPADQAAGSYTLVAAYGGDPNYTASRSPALGFSVTSGGSTLTTATSVALSSSSVTAGDPVRATATVTNGSNATALVGYVRFSVDGVPAGDAQVTAVTPATTPPSATAFLDVDSDLAAGGHTVTATYLGAATSASVGFKPSESSPASLQVVAPPAVDTLVTFDEPTAANPVIYGATNSVTVRVSPVVGDTAATGTVQLYDGDTIIATGELTGGALTVPLASLLPGSHSLTASYLGSGSLNAGRSTTPVMVKVSPATTTTTLVLATSAVAFGTAVQPTVTVTNASGTGVVPGGTVSILEGSTVLGAATLETGSATLSLPTTLGRGAHALRAVYTPGAGFAASASSSDVDVTVLGRPVAVSATVPSPCTQGTPCSVRVAVGAEVGRPVGSVHLLEAGTQVATSDYLGDAVALETPAVWATGTHELTVVFSSTSEHASGSVEISVVVAPAAPRATTSSLALSRASTTYGVAARVTVKVAAPGAVPTGTVVVLDGSTALATLTLSKGTVSTALPRSLAVGSHRLSVRYAGVAGFAGSTSSVTALRVTKASATARVKVSKAAITRGRAVTATATVTAVGVSPGGQVRFYDGGRYLGQVMLKGGRASYKLTRLGRGKHRITVRYLGSATTAAATSTAVTVRVR